MRGLQKTRWGTYMLYGWLNNFSPRERRCLRQIRRKKERLRNPEKVRAQDRRYASTPNAKRRRKKYLASYYQQHLDVIKTRALRWAKDNSGKVYERFVNRKAKTQSTPDELRKIAEWRKTWRSKPSVKCYWCKQLFIGRECEGDHIYSLASGGEHKLSNLCISCQPCNRKKAASHPMDFIRLIGREHELLFC